MSGTHHTLIPARSEPDMQAAASLFRQYADTLDAVDLSYQGFDAELASLPGVYAPPRGDLVLALDEAGRHVGCVGVRPFGEPGVCEMKRLFVAPEGRASGLGRRLAQASIKTAATLGYKEMWLDTLPTMGAAIALYRSLGFAETDAYYDTPIDETIFMRRVLR